MSLALPLRLAAFVAAFFVPRGKGPVTSALTGVFLGAAVFGIAKEPWLSPLPAAVRVFVLLLAASLVLARVFPPIASEGAVWGAAFALPVAVFAALAARALPAAQVFAAAVTVLAAVSIGAGEGSRANAEAGWRRGVVATAGVVLATAWAALAAALLPARPLVVVLVGVAVVFLGFLPSVLFEARRAKRELLEEANLGFLPLEDAAILAVPWKRRFEKRFGRADERREYVRSALLLAVARQQQRRRVGEAVRLRQLEILTFRTRLRRTLEARAGRFARAESGEFAGPSSAARS